MLPQDLLPELASLNALSANGEPEGMLMDVSALERLQQQAPPTEPTSLRNPLTISREQSAYSASAAVDNTLIVTFTVTNNQPPINIPELNTNATITDTIEVISSIDLSNDPNTVRNVLLTDELLPANATFIDAKPLPDSQGGTKPLFPEVVI